MAKTLLADPEDRDLLAVDQRAHAGVGQDVVEAGRRFMQPRLHAFLGRAGRIWPRSCDEHDVGVGLVAVDEVAEALERLRSLDRRLPLALVGVDVALHLGLELGADAERVVDTTSRR